MSKDIVRMVDNVSPKCKTCKPVVGIFEPSLITSTHLKLETTPTLLLNISSAMSTAQFFHKSFFNCPLQAGETAFKLQAISPASGSADP